MEKFTKGPWVACIRNDDQLQNTFFGVVMNRVYLQIGSGNENRINANLIAAAPDLYAEIKADLERMLETQKLIEGKLVDEKLNADIKRKTELLGKARGEL